MSTAPARPTVFAVEAALLCRRYGRRWALVDVDLRLPRGAALMVAGRNGSGKSTLLRVLAGAISPTRGSARVAGFDLVADLDEVRRRTALLGHASYSYDALSALENLRIAARFLGRAHGREPLRALLDEVGLAERADDAVETFSAGMRRRFALARVLIQDADVVLLDEPYGQLDPPGFSLVDRLFGRLRERGRTVLMATHLLERGADLCDEGLVLEAGRVAWTGPAADLPGPGVAAAGLSEGATA
ncbi:MAG TPA: heme ABC exporter ATP-binding protein CcmA [Vicinamibacteria bacterium]|nr:heme ABC exporter ATP-binding protein CcmA [Vicinamibacteria bacterium]